MTAIREHSFDVCVVGAGYIGYPLALLLATVGHRVLAVDINNEVLDAIASGVPRSEEDDVIDLAREGASQLRASPRPEPADVFIVTVPTPLDSTGRSPDLGHVEEAVRSLLGVLRPGNLVLIESTVPPGTTTGLVTEIIEEAGFSVGDEILLAHCPERLHPGATLRELTENDRILGGVNERSNRAARMVYQTFVTGDLVESTPLSAELCKLFENTYRDVNLALANAMAGIAEELGANADEVLRLASRHPRVEFLEPGIGVGGHCIPVDPWFLHHAAPEKAGLIEASRDANRAREQLVIERLADAVGGIDDPVVVIAGVAFKPDVADTRQSSALRIAEGLRIRGVQVRTFDPLALPDGESLVRVAEGADLVAVLVPHVKMVEQISAMRLDLEAVMRNPTVVDASSGAVKSFLA